MRGFPNCSSRASRRRGFTVNFPVPAGCSRPARWRGSSRTRWRRSHRGRTDRGSRGRLGRRGGAPLGRHAARAATAPGYHKPEGHANAKTRQGSFFFGTPTEYAEILESWRSRGDFGGLLRVRRRRYPVGRLRSALSHRHRPKVAIIGAGFRPGRRGGTAPAESTTWSSSEPTTASAVLAAQHLSRAACDIQVAPVLVLVRAQPILEPDPRAQQPEIPAYLESVTDAMDLRRHLDARHPVA